MFLNAFKEMGLKDAYLIGRSISLVTFSGETKNTIGEVVLPVYVEGVNKYTNFLVLDFLSTYNIILKRPWIHEMAVFP